MASARRVLDMETLNIGSIVNCTCEVPNYYENHEEIAVKYMKVEIDDNAYQDISKHFDATFEFISNSIENEGKAVLVHCQAGISRSSTIVIAYLMRKLDISLKDGK
ncbi:predicted protein [Naegleria gruberi]|uniref:protein-tyrosine-phosphatase n=1 Tax=Naegleria gruberi TaxID=5762 RepID=D2VQJ7_NAEGR|nr:uncharacterized protein NAEGRDRAFT_71250 [Naegleria gruberi]EFC40883.1 predicted protein [Naegleria gruberi]|eukprot:XP_002673627.1 predicted protein [Naegleria gruberi strain NEG-M]